MTSAILVIVPMVAVWLIVLLDIGVRRDLSGPARAGWVVLVTLVWPTLILYLLLRPVQGRLAKAAAVRRRDSDPRQELVAAVLDHRAGRISDDDYRARVAQLRRG